MLREQCKAWRALVDQDLILIVVDDVDIQPVLLLHYHMTLISRSPRLGQIMMPLLVLLVLLLVLVLVVVLSLMMIIDDVLCS